MVAWLDALNRKKFVASINGRDAATAVEMARYFSARLTPVDASPLERRVWEVAVAYADVTNTGPARRQVRQFVGTFMRKHDAVGALLELQAWARPNRCFQVIAAGGAAELTCEFVMLEHANQFPVEMVRRARRALMEHDLSLPA